MSVPFRYAFDLSTSMKLGPFSASLALPIHSDAYIDQDFQNRSEDMDWFQLLSATTNTTTPPPAIATLIPKLDLSLSLKPKGSVLFPAVDRDHSFRHLDDFPHEDGYYFVRQRRSAVSIGPRRPPILASSSIPPCSAPSTPRRLLAEASSAPKPRAQRESRTNRMEPQRGTCCETPWTQPAESAPSDAAKADAAPAPAPQVGTRFRPPPACPA